jgi:hypothetical protein
MHYEYRENFAFSDPSLFFSGFFVIILLRGLKRATKATKEHGKIERTYSVEETAAQDREHQSIP